MKSFYHSLRLRLFLWFVTSLLLMGFFIILTIHVYQYTYSIPFLGIVFILLALVGFVLINNFTRSLTYLSSQMKTISSSNLQSHIFHVKGRDEIAELAGSFNDLLYRLDAAFKRERQFIGDVAHEMKTPITTLKSSFEVALQKERSNEEYRHILINTISETDRITTTLQNILELAWAEVPHTHQLKNFNLSELLEELGEIAEKISIKKGIHVRCLVTPNIHIAGIRDRLGRAILNLIDNAIKYTPHNGTVEIALEKENNQAVVSVKDTGVGIEESEIERIFDRFYRGSKTDKVLGAGLGLAIARSTVQAHNGSIKVVSKPKQGSVFFIFLPLL